MTVEPLLISLQRHAASVVDRPALQDVSQTIDFKEFIRNIRAGAYWLREQGVRAGDRVILHGANSASFATAYFSVHAAGGIAVPTGADLSADGLNGVIRSANAVLILADLPQGLHGALSFPDFSQLPLPPQIMEFRCDPAAPADLLFTTGTTGRKKGVLLTHANIASAADNINAFVQNGVDDIEIVPVPLSHSFGLGRLRCWARMGHTMVLEQGLRNPALLFRRIIDLKATGLAIVPAGVSLLRRLIKDRFSEVSQHLRYIELGSAAISPEDCDWLLTMLPETRICHHYGLTEASRSAFSDLREDRQRPGTIGRPSPNVEISVADDQGRPVAVGVSGEILVRGSMVMQSYWRQPELTDTVLKDGWLHTGDEGWVDAEGYFYLRGRKGDTINVGGLKVAPEDVERCLCAIPQIKDAACIGVNDPRGVLGQVVKAFLVSDDALDEARIIDALRRHLAEHEVPRFFERVDALPRTESGKLRRVELRKSEKT